MHLFYYVCCLFTTMDHVILLWYVKLNWYVLMTLISQDHRHMLRTRAWSHFFSLNALPMHCLTMRNFLYPIELHGRCRSQPTNTGSIVDSNFLCFISCSQENNKSIFAVVVFFLLLIKNLETNNVQSSSIKIFSRFSHFLSFLMLSEA